MKKLLLLTTVLFAFTVSSCDLLGLKTSSKLPGTTWRTTSFDDDEIDYMEIRFKESTFQLWFKFYDFEKIEEGADGTYTVSGSNVRLTIEDEEDDEVVIVTGTVKGDTMTLNADGEVYTLRKQ